MNENMNNMNNINEEVEIDLRRIFEAVLSKAWTISAVSVICAVIMLFITVFAIVPQY